MAFAAAPSALTRPTAIPLRASTFTAPPHMVSVPPVRRATLRMRQGAPPQGAPPLPKPDEKAGTAQTATKTAPSTEKLRYGYIYNLRTTLAGTNRYFDVGYEPESYDTEYITSFKEYLDQVRIQLTTSPVFIYDGRTLVRNDFGLRRAVQYLGQYGVVELTAVRSEPEGPYFDGIETDEYKIRQICDHFDFSYYWIGKIPPSTLSEGDEGTRVRHLQYLLTRLELMSLSDTDQRTGYYGTLTERAVREFQRRCSIDRPTGEYDRETALWMERVISDLVDKGHKYL